MSSKGDFSFIPETRSTRQGYMTIRIGPRSNSDTNKPFSTRKKNENVP